MFQNIGALLGDAIPLIFVAYLSLRYLGIIKGNADAEPPKKSFKLIVYALTILLVIKLGMDLVSNMK